jgi:hypothetical protein
VSRTGAKGNIKTAAGWLGSVHTAAGHNKENQKQNGMPVAKAGQLSADYRPHVH